MTDVLILFVIAYVVFLAAVALVVGIVWATMGAALFLGSLIRALHMRFFSAE